MLLVPEAILFSQKQETSFPSRLLLSRLPCLPLEALSLLPSLALLLLPGFYQPPLCELKSGWYRGLVIKRKLQRRCENDTYSVLATGYT